MTCKRIHNGFICGPEVYRYKEFYFEWHSYLGPYPLNKDGEPSKRIPKGFWSIVDEFVKLSKEEQNIYKVG